MSAVFPSQGGFSFPQSRPDYRSQTAGGKRGTGLVVVVGLHAAVAWALASGLATEAVEFVRKPIEMAIIPEVAPPPPPPPPPPPKVQKIRDLPKVEAPPPPAYVPPPEVVVAPSPAPVIQAVQAEPPRVPVEIAPPPPPAPPAPVVEARPAFVKQEISLACPGYQNVLAQALEEAFERVGIAGTVRTLIKVRGNQVVDVLPQSGPKDYFKYVQSAVKRMRCSAGGAAEVQVTLDVQFKA